MDSLKTYFEEVLIKEVTPSVIRGMLAGLVGLILAHQAVLAKMGMDYDSMTWDLVIHLKKVAAWLTVMASTGGVTGLLRIMQHHTVAAVTGAPQSGDMRKMEPVEPVLNGQRKEDPK